MLRCCGKPFMLLERGAEPLEVACAPLVSATYRRVKDFLANGCSIGGCQRANSALSLVKGRSALLKLSDEPHPAPRSVTVPAQGLRVRTGGRPAMRV